MDFFVSYFSLCLIERHRETWAGGNQCRPTGGGGEGCIRVLDGVLRLWWRYRIYVRGDSSAEVDNFVLCQVESLEFREIDEWMRQVSFWPVGLCETRFVQTNTLFFFFSLLILESCTCWPLDLQAKVSAVNKQFRAGMPKLQVTDHEHLERLFFFIPS